MVTTVGRGTVPDGGVIAAGIKRAGRSCVLQVSRASTASAANIQQQQSAVAARIDARLSDR